MATSARLPFLGQTPRFAPEDWPNEEEHRRFLAEAIQALQPIGIVRTVTLTANQATTTLDDARISPEACIVLMPTTANAKAEGIPYQTALGDGTATLNHANNAQTDRDYCYFVVS